MTTLTQSYKAAKYHKKITIIFFLLFSLLLFLLTFISQLIYSQEAMMSFISKKWDYLKTILPQANTNFNEQLISSNHYITTIYDNFYVASLLSSIFIFFLLSIYIAKNRKEDIQTMQYIGIKKKIILKHLLMDLLLPIILSLSFIMLLFLIFQNQLINRSVNINRNMVNNYFDEELLSIHETNNINQQSTVSKLTKDSKVTTPVRNGLSPYNEATLFEFHVKSNSFRKTFTIILINFSKLCLTSFLGCLLGFYSYTTLFLSRRHQTV
ncbi:MULTISPECIES: FtsX-like permease family protein [Vagococcus]|uniref:ABC3 transporter permease C-terminal domain-containing protein n=1 Tax=Vagococcus fluvialis bH819 TaxID=1255619 RepID=A0A1X6WNM9_9ENTE|nr:MULTISPECIES: FtsX-like permease family protein [Vagococcus]SLM85885.1 hypothetical protein FM121_07270 [Vagococcus fluvialis bH819]HCM90305.1 hypothetical protein [Vagococcus sp.]